MKARVLLVEDEQEVRLVISRNLRRLGIQVDAAPSGSEAREILAAKGDKIDLLISDVVMPGNPGGLEFAQRFRDQYPHKPTVLISGYSHEANATAHDDEALLARLTKPVSQTEMANSIDTLLSKARSRI